MDRKSPSVTVNLHICKFPQIPEGFQYRRRRCRRRRRGHPNWGRFASKLESMITRFHRRNGEGGGFRAWEFPGWFGPRRGRGWGQNWGEDDGRGVNFVRVVERGEEREVHAHNQLFLIRVVDKFQVGVPQIVQNYEFVFPPGLTGQDVDDRVVFWRKVRVKS